MLIFVPYYGKAVSRMKAGVGMPIFVTVSLLTILVVVGYTYLLLNGTKNRLSPREIRVRRGEKLHKRRVELNLTRSQVASHLGITESLIEIIEKVGGNEREYIRASETDTIETILFIDTEREMDRMEELYEDVMIARERSGVIKKTYRFEMNELFLWVFLLLLVGLWFVFIWW